MNACLKYNAVYETNPSDWLFQQTMFCAVERKNIFLRALQKQHTQQNVRKKRGEKYYGQKKYKHTKAKQHENRRSREKKINFDVKNHRARNCGVWMNEGELPQLLYNSLIF